MDHDRDDRAGGRGVGRGDGGLADFSHHTFSKKIDLIREESFQSPTSLVSVMIYVLRHCNHVVIIIKHGMVSEVVDLKHSLNYKI